MTRAALIAALAAVAALMTGVSAPSTAARSATVVPTTVPFSPSAPPRPVAPAAWTVLELGDSITAGAASTDGTGYRGPLHQLLPLLTFTGTQGTAPLLHEGHSGWRIDQLATVHIGHPAFVLLHAGTNDAVQGHAAAAMLADMSSLLAGIQAASPGTRTYVAQIPISTWASPDQQAQEVAFDAGLPALAGRWVTVVDMRLQASELADGVHPTDTGYREMAQLWAAALPEVRAS